MITQLRFDRIHGKGAFARLRSMLDDPALSKLLIEKGIITQQEFLQKVAAAGPLRYSSRKK